MSSLRPVGERMGRVHAYLIEEADGITLVDALGKASGKTVLAAIAAAGRTVEDITNIVLTHSHLTHVKGAAELKRLSGARVFAPIAERSIIEGTRGPGGTRWLPERPYRVYPQQFLLNVSARLWPLGIRPSFFNHPPVTVDVPIDHTGQRVGPLIAIPTPGHSPGITSFYWPEGRTLFAGDAVVTWPELRLGWRGLTEDNDRNLASVGALVALMEERGWDARIIATGHGPPMRTESAVGLLRGLVGRETASEA
jgi:glyoxylase-like metal-dependent hydrolase (beta-lactamase superfamily II)